MLGNGDITWDWPGCSLTRDTRENRVSQQLKIDFTPVSRLSLLYALLMLPLLLLMLLILLTLLFF